VTRPPKSRGQYSGLRKHYETQLPFATPGPAVSLLHRRWRLAPLRSSTRARGAKASTIWLTINTNRCRQQVRILRTMPLATKWVENTTYRDQRLRSTQRLRWTNSHLYELRTGDVGARPIPMRSGGSNAGKGTFSEDIGTKKLVYLYDFGEAGSARSKWSVSPMPSRVCSIRA
jgi:hypothetical protein